LNFGSNILIFGANISESCPFAVEGGGGKGMWGPPGGFGIGVVKKSSAYPLFFNDFNFVQTSVRVIKKGVFLAQSRRVLVVQILM